MSHVARNAAPPTRLKKARINTAFEIFLILGSPADYKGTASMTF
jgi:hypothetical protein